MPLHSKLILSVSMYCFDDKGTRPNETYPETGDNICCVRWRLRLLQRQPSQDPSITIGTVPRRSRRARRKPQTGADRDMRYSFNAAQEATEQAATAGRGRRHGRHARVTRDPRQGTDANASSVAAQSHSNSAFGGVTSDALVSEARKYIGTNPTGRGSLWCGAFMDLVLKRTGHTGGGNLASGYARYGTRVSGPQVGAIAVMGRRGGGHVGVVSGIDPNGNPIIVSGNPQSQHRRSTRWPNRFIRAAGSSPM